MISHAIQTKIRAKLEKARRKILPRKETRFIINHKIAKRLLLQCANCINKKAFINHLYELEIAVEAIMIRYFSELLRTNSQEERMDTHSFEYRIFLLRSRLLRLLDKEDRDNKVEPFIYDAAYKCLLILSAYWPKEYKHKCCISDISFQNRKNELVLLSSGYQCHRSVLKSWLSTYTDHVLVDGEDKENDVKIPLPLSERDINHILARIPDLDPDVKKKFLLLQIRWLKYNNLQ